MNIELKNRIKSFLWRAGAAVTVSGGAYFLKIGDLWQLDFKTLVNLGAVAVATLAVAEVTKWLNK